MRPLSRSHLIGTLRARLETSPHVYAAWLEGADALGRVDAYSDIDLWVDVEDGFEAETVDLVRKTLNELGSLDVDFEQMQQHPQLQQHFFHVEGSSPFLLLDLNLQANSRDLAFTRGQDAAQVLFDKAGVVRWQEAPDQARRLEQRKQFLSAEFEVSQCWVDKALARGAFLEALAAYHSYTLRPLVELLRAEYTPYKYDYHLKHVYQDLPAEVVGRLEHLYAVDSLITLESRYQEAKAWLEQLTNG